MNWLQFGAAFDWISPLLAWMGDAAHGGRHAFLVPHGCGWSSNEIARLLARAGVESWGRMVIDGMMTISVRPAQAMWAQRVLDGAGVPIASGRVESRQDRRERMRLERRLRWTR